jgi:hypothetical protein
MGSTFAVQLPLVPNLQIGNARAEQTLFAA